jgi:amidase
MSASEICYLTASQQRQKLLDGELSAREIMNAHLAQIERVNPKVNAVVTLLPERAIEGAAEADEKQARGEELGPLHGLPIAQKDLVETKGIRTTYGSPIYADNVPEKNSLLIDRLQAAGAITIGKTNTPEFGAGSQTFNPVFGATLNPYDTSKTCGGSSGGAAVALACGMIPIADGSDTGGSLRNPANFCNVVGFRPSPGRVPVWPAQMGWFPISVSGPMGRTVEDVALQLGVMAGPDSRCPISIEQPGDMFQQSLEIDFKGSRIAWSQDFGELPVDSRVTSAIDSQRSAFESIGCEIVDDCPDFADADETFKAWRAWKFEHRFRPLLESHGDLIKDTIHWNCEAGRELTGPYLSTIEAKRTALFHRVREFQEDGNISFLILPVSQVPPFDVDTPYISDINGTKLETYIDWMKSCYYISAIGNPSISVPCGFTPEGLPVGVQIVGRHNDDLGVLQLAYAFQQATEVWKHVPPVAE